MTKTKKYIPARHDLTGALGDWKDHEQNANLVRAVQATHAITFNSMSRIHRVDLEKLVRDAFNYAGKKCGIERIERVGFYESKSGNNHVHCVARIPDEKFKSVRAVLASKFAKDLKKYCCTPTQNPNLLRLQQALVQREQLDKNSRPHVYVDNYNNKVPKYIVKMGIRAHID